MTGGTGDGSLEMHEFLEAVVLLAFERAASSARSAIMMPRPSRRRCPDASRRCSRSIYSSSEEDALAKTKMVEKDPEVQIVFRPFRDKLKAQFEIAATSDSTMTAGKR